MTKLILGFALFILPITSAIAGGPTCSPGYCLDWDGNGCHKCETGKAPKIHSGKGSTLSSKLPVVPIVK